MTTCLSMRAGLFMLVSAGFSTTASAQYQAIWRVEDGGNGHVYDMVLAPTATWDESVGIAHFMLAHLATLSTEAEANWVYENCVDAPMAWFGPSGPWFGAIKDPDWRWIDGSKWEWDPWSNGLSAPPSNSCSFESTILQFVHPSCQFSCANNWGDTVPDFDCYGSSQSTCNTLRPTWFVVEWDEDCDQNGQVDKRELIDNQALDVNGNQVLDACECLADLTDDNATDSADLVIILDNWGEQVPPNTPGDYNRDGIVDHKDLMTLLNNWGVCGYCYSC